MSNLFELQGPMRPGDVVLLFAGPSPTEYVLGAWLQSIAQDAHRAVENVPIFVIGLDRATMGAKSAAIALEDLSKKVGNLFPIPRLIELGTEDAEISLAACPFEASNAIVAILDVERLRFSDLYTTGPQVESVEGSVIRISEKDDLCRPHVVQLCAQICQKAPSSGQKWLIVSRGYSFGAEIPAALVDFPNLDISELQEMDHDAALAGEFRQMLGTVQTGGPEKAFRWVNERLPSGKMSTIAKANIFSLCEQPIQAYRVMAEISGAIIKDAFPEEIIQLSQMALSAGIAEDSLKWINHLPPPETLELENLRAARLLAKKLNHNSLMVKCVAEFRRRFPSHPLTQLDQFNELLDAKNYEGAAQQAAATGNPYRREIALFLANPAELPLGLLKAAESAGELSEAYWIIGVSARDRKEYTLARDRLRHLSDDERRGGTSVAMRIEILRAQVPGIPEGDMQDELRSLLRWCANHPAELEARFALEELYESVSTEREALAHTIALMSAEMHRLATSFEPSAIPLRAALEERHRFEKTDHLPQLMRELFGPVKRDGVALGTAKLTPAQAKLITPQLWHEMGICLSSLTDHGNEQGATQLLHVIMAAARETHDPASDLLAARQVIALLAMSAKPQQALDLAETLLTLLPENHSDHKEWRLSMAWLIYADVSLRLGNVLGGLRFISFASLCLQKEPLHARLFLEVFRTAARVARGIHLPPLALELLELEGKLLGSFPLFKDRARELQQMTLSIMLTMWSPSDGPAPMLAIAHEALALLEQTESDDEVAPLLSVAAQAAQFSEEHGGGPIRADVRGKLESYLGRVPESSRGSIRAILGDLVTIDLLRNLATRTIRASADWSASLVPALVAARKALSQACDSRDPSLFWTACLILCQPGLSVRVSERDAQNPHADPVTASKWLAKQIRAGTSNPLEVIQVQRAMSHASSEAVGEKLFEITMAEFLDLIDPLETVVLLAADNANRLYRLELRHGSAGLPTRVSSDEWDIKRFNAWSRVYPAKYGLVIEVYFGAVCKPPAAEVAPTLSGLLPSGRMGGPIATLVAEGRFLAFTHRLASDLAGSSTSLAVCPSARWLGVTRRRIEPKPQRPVAWLGSPQSSERVVKALQSELTPIMRLLNIEVSLEETLPDFRNNLFVILGSHGRANNEEGFSRVSDDEQDYEPDRVAAALAGTTCVVLFVCHGGRGDEAMFSHETNGLTSSLLRHGVRTVVAALWPVDVTIVTSWLEEFGKTKTSDSIVERVDQAQRAMAKQKMFAEITGENPLVRCTFTVFGDGCLRIGIPNAKPPASAE